MTFLTIWLFSFKISFIFEPPFTKLFSLIVNFLIFLRILRKSYSLRWTRFEIVNTQFQSMSICFIKIVRMFDSGTNISSNFCSTYAASCRNSINVSPDCRRLMTLPLNAWLISNTELNGVTVAHISACNWTHCISMEASNNV